MKRLSLLILPVLALALLIMLYPVVKGTLSNTENNEETIPESELTVAAWIPYWDYNRGLQTLQNNQDKFSSISPVIYEPLENGDLKQLRGESYKNIQAFSQTNNIQFIPSIALFDHEVLSKILRDENNLNNHIYSIIQEIRNNRFDGVDLDYESTKLDDKEQYNRFITTLSSEIDTLEATENRKITLSITVLAQWGPIDIYPSLRETRQVQDWKFISPYADEIRIMAYDFFNQYSSQPGPIAPTFWIESILNKAIAEIPKEKIVLGVHTYSYNWAAQDIELDLNSILATESTLQADAYTFDQVQEVLDRYPHTILNNPLWGEKYVKYQREAKDRILVYTDAETIRIRRDIAKRYGIKGVSYWRLGGDTLLEY